MQAFNKGKAMEMDRAKEVAKSFLLAFYLKILRVRGLVAMTSP